MSTWPGIDEFRRILAEYGHPEERINWLAGLVSTPGLGEPHVTFGTEIHVWAQWRISQYRLMVVNIDSRYLHINAIEGAGKIAELWLPLSGDYQRIGSLVWQDALKTLGIAAEVTA